MRRSIRTEKGNSMSDDTYSIPTPEAGTGRHQTPPPFNTTTQVPTGEGPHPKRKKRTRQVVLIYIALFAVVCIAVGVTVSTIRAINDGPVWRTLRAVIPGAETIETMVQAGGDVQIAGSVGGELLSLLNGTDAEALNYENYIGFYAGVAYNPYGEFHAYGSLSDTRGDIADVDFIFRQNGAELSSNTFLREPLAVEFKGLAERLENSIFAPDSGSDYALDESAFETLLDMARSYDPTVPRDPDSGISVAEMESVLTDVFKRVIETAEKEMIIRKTRNDVKLTDGSARAKLYTYTFTETYVFALIDALRIELDENEDLEDLLRRYYSTSGDGTLTDEELEDMNEIAYKEIITHIKDTLSKIEQYVTDNPFTCHIEAGIKSRYLVSLNVRLSFSDTTEADVIDRDGTPINGYTFSARFSSNPKYDPSFNIQLTQVQNKQTVFVLTAEQSVKTDSAKITRTFSVNLDSYENDRVVNQWNGTVTAAVRTSGAYVLDAELTYKEGNVTATILDLTAEGRYQSEFNTTYLSLEYVELTVINQNDNKPLAFGENSFYVEIGITTGTPALPALSGEGVDPTTMTESAAKRVVDHANSTTETFLRKLNQTIYGTPDGPFENPFEFPSDTPSEDYPSVDLPLPLPSVEYRWQQEMYFPINGTVSHAAIDAEAGFFYSVVEVGEQSYLNVFSFKDLHHAGEIQLTGTVTALAAGDGYAVIAYQNDAYLRIWDAETLQQTATLYCRQLDDPAMPGQVTSLAIRGGSVFCTLSNASQVFASKIIGTRMSPLNISSSSVLIAPDPYQDNLWIIFRNDLSEITNILLFKPEKQQVSETYLIMSDTASDGLPRFLGQYAAVNDRYYDFQKQSYASPMQTATESLNAPPERILIFDDTIHAYAVKSEASGMAYTDIFDTNGHHIGRISSEVIDMYYAHADNPMYITLETSGRHVSCHIYSVKKIINKSQPAA